MRIENFNTYNKYNFTNNTPNTKNLTNNKITNTPNPTNTTNYITPSEYLGRSQIIFKGKKQELSDIDKQFIKNVSEDLRLDENENKKLTTIIKDYVKTNNLKSLKEISDEEHINEQAELTEIVTQELDLSDTDSMTFSFALVELDLMDNENYTPIPKRYAKDIDILEQITEKNKLSQDEKVNLFDVMATEAEIFNYKTIFDMFNKENRSPKSMTVQYINRNYSHEQASDLILDFAQIASMDEKSRFKGINQHKYKDDFYNPIRNEIIWREIQEEFNLSKNCKESVIKEIENRKIKQDDADKNKESMKIAYFISEKFDLPNNAERKISDIIKKVDNYGLDKLDEYFINIL